MFKNVIVMDKIRTGTLFGVIEEIYWKDEEPATFRFEGDGLRLITNLDTVVNDWTPRQVEEALRELEVAGKIEVSGIGRAHTSEFHVEASPLRRIDQREESEWCNLSLEELTKLVQTNDEFCANMVLDLWVFEDRVKDEIPDLSLFSDMSEKLAGQTGITRRQLAICRMPGETGIPRLARCIQQIDQLLAKRARTNLLLTLYRV